MRLTKTLLACALAAAALPSFADKTITFEPGLAGAPSDQPFLLNGGYFGASFNGGGAWLTSKTLPADAQADCPAGGQGEFQVHAAGNGFANGGGCGALNLTSTLEEVDPTDPPPLTKLVIGVSAVDAFNSFEFWWSQKQGKFTVSFLDGDGREIAGIAKDFSGDDTVGNTAYADWHYENAVLNLKQGELARYVVFSYGNDYGTGMIDDLRFKNIQGGTVPEPTSYALVLAALGGVAFARRRNKKA